ncbi:hypothetical protein SAMN05421760_10998 [Neptunomonas antarctica]|uniref:Uncharacterized protein n=1 Tax=Neptunomonas antarctica TaxID=619304 RepID=A0A1N7NG30_9GAMM|nr:hypothetical protein SAMN05421760_10998 [Neptunomonas antarctica]
MRNITTVSYRLALVFITLAFSSASVQAETKVIASGALNLFFPHSGVSISLGQPQIRYHDARYSKEMRHSQEKRYSKNNQYYKKASTQYLVITQPIRQRVVIRDHQGKSEHDRLYQHIKHKEHSNRHKKERKSRHEDKYNNYYNN